MKYATNLKSSKVADYYFLVGIDEALVPTNPDTPKASVQSFVFTPRVLDRYPAQEHADTPFPEGVHLFCLPRGVSVSDSHRRATFHSFVHTSENGKRLLGSCLTFYEPLTEEQVASFRAVIGREGSADALDRQLMGEGEPRQWWSPRCMCLISQWPFAHSFKQVLCQLYLMSFDSLAVPLERHICNFIDDVPAPPVGRVDINYCLGPATISFSCPPLNQPHAWSGLPLTPLFECLSAPNVIKLFSAVACERQIIYLSSQYSLLTYCIEAITSLLYPLKWSHVYIPILPLSLIGVLAAPVPFQCGVLSSFILAADDDSMPSIQDFENARILQENPVAVKVYLDYDHIEFGEDGPPPPLPETRGKKLADALVAAKAAEVFAKRNIDAIGLESDWVKHKLPHYDDAFAFDTPIRDAFLAEPSPSPEGSADDGSSSSPRKRGSKERAVLRLQGHHSSFASLPTVSVDERALRHGFLAFFVAVLQNYRRFLVYASRERPTPLCAFRSEAFLAEHPADWQPFLEELVRSQALSQFIDERVGRIQSNQGNGVLYSDVVFFDESIDAKVSRYYFSMVPADTPFLSSTADEHAKSYVPPSPDASGLEALVPEGATGFSYARFPLLSPALLAPHREGNMNSAFEAAARGQALAAAAGQARLKKATSGLAVESLSIASCHFSCFLTVLSHFVLSVQEPVASVRSTRPSATAVELKLALSNSPLKLPDGLSLLRSAMPMARRASTEEEREEDEREAAADSVMAASKLAVKVSIEVLNSLTKMNDTADEISYRYLVDACAKCGESCSAVEMIALICAMGFEPDTSLVSAVASAVSKDKSDNHVDPDDIWTTKDWRSLYLKLQRIKVNDVPVLVPHGRGVLNRAMKMGDDLSTLPKIQWSGFAKVERSTVFAASPRLMRHMILAENLLGEIFPDLEIDLNHPFGTSCPNHKCCKPQSIGHILGGFSRDQNVYTTKCYSCECMYVPRFTVQCSLDEWEGSEKVGPGSILWCELLSPWVLRKEVFSVLFVDGVEAMISVPSNKFRKFKTQNAVVFWNMIVAFRLRGLPYSFLLTPSLVDAFPDKKRASKVQS